MKKHILLPLLTVTMLLIVPGCKKENTTSTSGGSTGTPGANEVFMQGNSFTPANLTVPVNTTVRWVNKDGADHTVTSSTGAFGSGTVSSGGSYSHQFTTTGTYPYRCTIHASMTGTITVQ